MVSAVAFEAVVLGFDFAAFAVFDAKYFACTVAVARDELGAFNGCADKRGSSLGAAGFTRWIGATMGSIGLAETAEASDGVAGCVTWPITGDIKPVAASTVNQSVRATIDLERIGPGSFSSVIRSSSGTPSICDRTS